MKRVMGWVWVFALVGCASARPAEAAKQENVMAEYTQAVHHSAIVGQGDIRSNLVAINDKNPNLIWNRDHTRLLVATWKSRSSYESYLKGKTHTSPSEDYAIWVTAAPQVQSFCRNFMAHRSKATSKALNLRLKQYLGLDPDWSYDVFIEMWVSPKQMFRPCVDPEIGDSTCNLKFGSKPPAVRGIADYERFYRKLYFNDFRYTPGVPWTGLGYTYDWGNSRNHEGASEFILVPGAVYTIKRVVPTAAYCAAQGGR